RSCTSSGCASRRRRSATWSRRRRRRRVRTCRFAGLCDISSESSKRRMTSLKYPRVLLKLSGEALAGDKGFGYDFDTVNRLADEVVSVMETGASLGMVIGGGNIVRGSQLSKTGMDRVAADYMGMLGTVINAMAVQDVLERKGVDTRVMTAIRMEEIAEPYIRRRAIRHLEKGRVTLFAAGTGNPYFSTDTAAVLRAIQIKANVIIKATSVEGVYSADPK